MGESILDLVFLSPSQRIKLSYKYSAMVDSSAPCTQGEDIVCQLLNEWDLLGQEVTPESCVGGHYAGWSSVGADREGPLLMILWSIRADSLVFRLLFQLSLLISWISCKQNWDPHSFCSCINFAAWPCSSTRQLTKILEDYLQVRIPFLISYSWTGTYRMYTASVLQACWLQPHIEQHSSEALMMAAEQTWQFGWTCWEWNEAKYMGDSQKMSMSEDDKYFFYTVWWGDIVWVHHGVRR